MCGIFGFISDKDFNSSLYNFEESLELLSHRGPDGKNIFYEDKVFLGHHRLSIIDIDTRSTQPMIYKKLIITYNGEIYNFKEIKKNLLKKGYIFNTTSDTEVILASWLEWKERCLDKFEGMFAFGIWDKFEKKLYLARDKIGEKPLFWAFKNGNFVFSSELPPIVNALENKFIIDNNSLNLYLKLSYIPAPKTIYENVNQLEPGSYLVFNSGKISIKKYFQIMNLNKKIISKTSYPKLVNELKIILNDSVKCRLETSDVPVATLLSGGIDSSIITYLASKNNKDKKISAYTLGFPEDPEYDETFFAKECVKNIKNVDHKIINVNEKLILDNIPNALKKLSEPFADASFIPTYYLFSHIEEKVVLSGDGADEIFGGYGVYPAILKGMKIPNLLKNLIKYIPKTENPIEIKNKFLRGLGLFLKNYDQNNTINYLNWRSYSNASTLHKLNIDNNLLNEQLEKNNLHQFYDLNSLLKLDLRFNLPNDMLKKVDYASMFNGIEVRLPFLDSKLVEFAVNLPESYLIKGKFRKKILKDTFVNIFDKNFVNRRKQGFLLPIRKWFVNGQLRDDFEACLKKSNDFDVEVIKAMLAEHTNKTKDHSVTLWGIYIYLMWKKNYFSCDN